MKKIITIFILCLSFTNLWAQEHFYDFIYYGESSNPTNFYKAHNSVYFTATNNKKNLCLYKTDGSKTGTKLLHEFTNGASLIRQYTPVGQSLFFTVYTTSGTQIWYTKGSQSSTKQFYQSQSFYANREIDLFEYNDWLIFQDQISEDSFYIRRLDTTLNNNIIVARHKHGHVYSKGNFVKTSDYLFYSFNDKLYRVDNNFSALLYWERSTSTAGDIPYLYSSNNVVIWYMRVSGSSKTQVYAVNETGANVQEIELLYGYPAIYDHLTNGNFFYYAIGEYNGYPKLYRLNTQNFNSAEISYCYTRDRKIDIEVFDGQVYYSNLNNGDCELYKVGNLSSNPTKVSNIANDTSSNPQSFISYNNKLYFSAFTKNSGREFYQSEGTAASTKMAFDFLSGAQSSNFGINSIEINGKLLASGLSTATGSEIWITDGTELGTELLLDINPDVDRGNQQVSSFMPVGNYLYLFANDSINGAELWRTDGSEAGTQFLDNINIANFPSAIEEYVDFKGDLYGTAVSFIDGIELYTSNGTSQGSKFVTPSDLFSSSAPHDYVVDGNYFYFIGNTGLFGGQAIFRSDGTKAGTNEYLGNGSDIKSINNLRKVGNKILVSITKQNNETHLYWLNTDKKKLFKYSTVATNEIQYFTDSDTALVYLFERNGTWRLGRGNTNVSIAGQKVAHLAETKPDTFFTSGDKEYMVARTTSNKDIVLAFNELKYLHGLFPTTPYNQVESIVGFNGGVIFSAQHQTLGQELFIYKSTDTSAVLLSDINTGSASSNPDNFYVFNDRLIFTATTATNGTEVWITDGTSAGTKLLWDIQKGSRSSYPTEYTAYKGYLYISASDSIREKSLYRFIIDSCDIIAPEIASNKNSFVVCEGETIDLYAKTGIEIKKLTWYKNGNPIITAGDTFTTNEIGKYKFEVANGSCAVSSAEIELKSAPAVEFTVAFENDSAFCNGGSINLLANGDAGLTVKWYRNNNEYSSQLKTTTFADGKYFAIGRNSFGCRDTSKTLLVTVYENPEPKVELYNDTLWCSYTDQSNQYQWFFKGVEINGQTNAFVVPTENGAYKVAVIDSNGCSGESNGYKYEGSSISDFNIIYNISAYPNPFDKNTLISYDLPKQSHVKIEVYNELGQKIETLVAAKQSAGKYQFEFKTSTGGIYFVKMQIGEEYDLLKLINTK
ncbi:MAG: T9SS type A sorting domain-containing protein [Bacteroidia bacterium]